MRTKDYVVRHTVEGDYSTYREKLTVMIDIGVVEYSSPEVSWSHTIETEHDPDDLPEYEEGIECTTYDLMCNQHILLCKAELAESISKIIAVVSQLEPGELPQTEEQFLQMMSS
jgi:hypothetical protein